MQKPFEITVLGTSSATPTRDRNPSAQYVRLDKHYFLIDVNFFLMVLLVLLIDFLKIVFFLVLFVML